MNIMKLLIYADANVISRTRLFLAIVQQRTILDGTRTLSVAGTANDFHIISHQDSIHLHKYALISLLSI